MEIFNISRPALASFSNVNISNSKDYSEKKIHDVLNGGVVFGIFFEVDFDKWDDVGELISKKKMYF